MLASLLLIQGGCGQGGLGGFRFGGLPPTVDRLVAAYPDMESRRFQVIADFESPVQGTLFHLDPAGGPGSVGVSTDRAQLKTGVGSLKVSFSQAGQRLICEASPDSQWGFPRDWSKYHLLLVSVYSPRQIGGFGIGARSGTNLQLRYENPRNVLRPGWNLLRLDLGDFAEQIDLSDVRELDFTFDALDAPIELYLDDLILVDNSRDILTSAANQPGDLYLRAAGRRLIVGAIDRFELTFSRGRPRQWFDLGFDKTRIHNLVGIGPLGPNPVPLATQGSSGTNVDDAGRWFGTGTTVETYQSLLSATPMQVVIQGEWRFTPPRAEASRNRQAHRWVYSIYPDGRIYVECGGTALGQETAGQIGLTFCCDGDSGFDRRQVESAPAGGPSASGGQDPFMLFSRSGRGQADLLVVPSRPLASCGTYRSADSRLCGCWAVPIENEQFSLACLIRVWPADIDSPEQAIPLAADYAHPLPLQLDAGQLVRTDAGDLNNDGFNEGRGYFVLQLDGSIARVRIDGRQRLRFSPMFKLVDVATRDVWIYLDGRQIKETMRDEDGNILFVVPEVISREALLEITSRTHQAEPKSPPR